MIRSMPIPVIIVSYRNPQDVISCLWALRKSAPEPAFDVYICENGGGGAFRSLIEVVIDPKHQLCERSSDPVLTFGNVSQFDEVEYLRYRDRNCRVTIGQACENLGYAGAINLWFRTLLPIGNWHGAWILNPDTEPSPAALGALVACASERGLGMVGSRIIKSQEDGIVLTRGLRWSRLRATTVAVDRDVPTDRLPDLDQLEAHIDAVSGCSVYVTRACLESVGLMSELYFLYFEDLEWGVRAKRKAWKRGYADASIVVHEGGTTIGSARGHLGASTLSVYLDFRNRILFVRNQHRYWMLWALLVLLVRAMAFGLSGASENMHAAINGLVAGIRGETGRPAMHRCFAGTDKRPVRP
jgi:GT2 family glycosyltransferase